jgi:hypothetical protein
LRDLRSRSLTLAFSLTPNQVLTSGFLLSRRCPAISGRRTSQAALFDALSTVRMGRAAALPVVLGAGAMAVTTFLVCETTWQKLGNDGLAELAECLWPVDCQSCGRFLGGNPPAVVVDDLHVAVVVSLHHQRCRRPEWNDSMLLVVGSGQYTTFVARMMLLPVTGDDGMAGAYPLMLVNPGLECVQLQRGQNGKWHVGYSGWLDQAGLVRPGPQLALGTPVDGLVARATDSSVAVVLQVPPFTVYEGPADDRVLDRVRALGGVLVAVTPTLNPGDFAYSDLLQALADPRTLAGWAGLHGTLRQRRRRFRLRQDICVLHWNDEQLSVGKLVRRAPGRLSADRARTWAEHVISAAQGEPLTWRPVQESRPDEGWHARGSFSAQEHVLRRHPDGWKLVLVCGQAAADKAETDNEAKAWAADTLKLQAGISGLTWRPGPSTPGSITLYGIA